jgi:lipoprotein signal peptidase
MTREPASNPVVTRALSLGMKQPEREANHHLHLVEVKNSGALLSLLNTSSW